MSGNIDELKLDVAELEKLHQTATRTKVKDIIGQQIQKLQLDIVSKNKPTSSQSIDNAVKISSTSVQSASRIYTVNLTTYGFDQTDKFMKIYLTLNGVQNLSKDNTTCDFTENSFNLLVSDLGGKNHRLHVGNLYSDILTDGSYFKIKTDMVLVMLKKAESGKVWAYVTKHDEKAKEKPAPKMDEKDPNAGLMDLMKKMYDDGDDEMKRTIGKAWTESREKQMGMGGMEMGGNM